MTDPLLLRVQAVLAGRFAVERELGRGGMGVVYLARDLALDRPVAVKVLAPRLAEVPELRARFLAEARLAARLSHPHVVPVHAVEDHGAIVLFVMALVEGETLGQRVRRTGPLGESEAARVIREVAWALGYAHRLGIVHRDVKPDNVVLEKGSGRALVLDFGIAEVTADQPAGRGAMGTPRYMSPEQLAGRSLDGRSDLYSLGVTAYYALTGRHLAEAARGLPVHAPPDAPALAARDLPRSLAPIVERCLAPDPGDRIASGEDLAVALDLALGRPAPVPEPVRRFLDLLATLGLEVSSYVAIVAVLGGWAALLTDLSGGVVATVFTYAVFIMAGLFVLRSGQLLRQAGRLLSEGLGALDVRRALEQSLPAEPPPRGPIWTRVAAVLGGGAAWVFAVRWWDATSRGVLLDGLLFAALTLVPVVLLRKLIGSLWLPRRPGRWARLWWWVLEWKVLGWAALGRSGRPAPPLVEDRTELALESNARALYRALPPALRSRFTEVPTVIGRLADRLARLRASSPDPTPERLRNGLLAMERLRLRLLELGAGAADERDLTSAIEAAKAVGLRIDRLLEARREVEGALEDRLPAGADPERTPTPI
jgi:eukaryotic-like serine/threonine-protein kinase